MYLPVFTFCHFPPFSQGHRRYRESRGYRKFRGRIWKGDASLPWPDMVVLSLLSASVPTERSLPRGEVIIQWRWIYLTPQRRNWTTSRSYLSGREEGRGDEGMRGWDVYTLYTVYTLYEGMRKAKILHALRVIITLSLSLSLPLFVTWHRVGFA